MKKIIVISDTHGNTKGIEKLMPIIAENDYLIHLGDGSADLRQVWKEYPDKNLRMHMFQNQRFPYDRTLHLLQW